MGGTLSRVESDYVFQKFARVLGTSHADPRENRTTKAADRHLAVKPGCHIPLPNGMYAVVFEEGMEDEAFLRERVSNGSAFRGFVTDLDVDECADLAGVDAADLREVARVYANAQRAAAFAGMGMSQHRYGTTNVQALINLASMTGNIGKRGVGVNPLRGKNNVQGASDVGALSVVLPGYRPVTDSNACKADGEIWGSNHPLYRD